MAAEAVKVVVDIVCAVLDRREKQKQTEKRIVDLEAEVARLKTERQP